MKLRQLIHIILIRLGICGLIIFFYLFISSYDISSESSFQSQKDFGLNENLEYTLPSISFIDNYLNKLGKDSWSAFFFKWSLHISQSFVAWDSVYFVELTQSSLVYRQENIHAFFPGFPFIAYHLRKLLFDWWINENWKYITSIWSCVIVSNISFVLASVVLFYLTKLVFNKEISLKKSTIDEMRTDENINSLSNSLEKTVQFDKSTNLKKRNHFQQIDSSDNFNYKPTLNPPYNVKLQMDTQFQFAEITCYLFALTPASVFCSSPYTEPLFSLVSFIGMYLWVKSKGNSLLASFIFGLGSFIRGNGILLSGFFLFGVWKLKSRKLFILPQIILTIFPYFLVQTLGYLYYCSEWNENLQNDIQYSSLDYLKKNHPWCLKSIPQLYSYVQRKYWNVGFFRYWTLAQIPNFLLALPVTMISLFGIYFYAQGRIVPFVFVRDLQKKKSYLFSQFQNWFQNTEMLPVFMYYQLFQVFYILIAAHSQILTRFLVASPCMHWISAFLFIEKKNWRPIIITFNLLYIFIGCILHPNFFPWT